MERSEYLIPLIERWSEDDQEFLEDWVTRWLDVHEENWTPNQGSHDDMGIGKRGMILTWYLRELRLSRTDNVELLERLMRSLKEHQTHLENEGNFTTESNHGMWEALGLFETTRVIENRPVTELALKRMMKIASISVSEYGFHLEHSPSYHYYFLGWLDELVPYLESLDLAWAELDSLAAIRSNMYRMTYFLCDHALNVPQIGDTDASKLDEEPLGREARKMGPSVLDKRAGYAIFKDPHGAAAKRYVVFSCQNKKEKLRMRYHCHNDVLAVYYADDGEIILGDAGRYSYTNSQIRRFVRSAEAHNGILSKESKGGRISGLDFAEEVREISDDDLARFEVTLWAGLVTRVVEIPYGGDGLTVTDRIVADNQYTVLWHMGRDVESVDALPPRMVGPAETHVWRVTTRKGREFDLAVSIEADSTAAEPAVDTLTGLENPYRGWYSSGYRAWEPTTVLSITVGPGKWVSLTMELKPVQ